MYINTSSNGLVIIDAVLTDKGRLLLREGKFKIVKFACSDLGVDYSLATGSIESTRILEAPVDQTQSMIYRLYTNTAVDDNTTTITTR